MGTILGTIGADSLNWTASADIVRLFAGYDSASALAGDDSLYGGNDRVLLFGR